MYISPDSEKSETIRFRVTRTQNNIAIKTYRSLGFETLSQYMRYLLNQANETTLAAESAQNVVSLHVFNKNKKDQNRDTNRHN